MKLEIVSFPSNIVYFEIQPYGTQPLSLTIYKPIHVQSITELTILFLFFLVLNGFKLMVLNGLNENGFK